jgi:hypothetical protein
LIPRTTVYIPPQAGKERKAYHAESEPQQQPEPEQQPESEQQPEAEQESEPE